MTPIPGMKQSAFEEAQILATTVARTVPVR